MNQCNSKKLITQMEFNNIVNDLCRKITISNWKPDYIVGITRGGLTPAVMISHYFSIPMYALHVSLRDNGSNNESNLWMAEDAFGYVPLSERKTDANPPAYPSWDSSASRNILIVDDINDTGATINWILDDWQSSCLPKDSRWNDVWNNNVRFLTIVDNLSSECKVKIDYTGIEINKAEHSVWVDFPYETWWK